MIRNNLVGQWSTVEPSPWSDFWKIRKGERRILIGAPNQGTTGALYNCDEYSSHCKSYYSDALYQNSSMFGSTVKEGFLIEHGYNGRLHPLIGSAPKIWAIQRAGINLKTILSGLMMIYLYLANHDSQNIRNAIEWRARKIFSAKGTVIFFSYRVGTSRIGRLFRRFPTLFLTKVDRNKDPKMILGHC